MDKFVKNAQDMALSSQPPHKKSKINTVLNLITFSIVFTIRNKGDTFSPPPILTNDFLLIYIVKLFMY